MGGRMSEQSHGFEVRGIEVDDIDQLSKETNWWGAFVIGLAGTILVLGLVGYALVAMGPFSIVMFAVLTGAGVFLCFCLAELAAAMPDKAGGLPAYAFDTFSSWGKTSSVHLGGLSSWGYWLGWFTVAPIFVLLAADYLVALLKLGPGKAFDPFGAFLGLPTNTTRFFTALVLLIAMFIPCYLGIRLGARFATMLGIACLIPLLFLIIAPFFKPSTLDFGAISGFHFEPNGVYAGTALTWPFVLGWAFIFTWSVLAMEAAACYIGECKEPVRDAKIAMTAEGLFGLFVYIMLPLMMLAVVGVVGLQALFDATDGAFIGDASPLFLAYTAKLFGTSEVWRWIVGLMLIVALLLTVLNAVMGCSRGLYQNAHDGLLPRFFGKTNRHSVPSTAMLFSLVCSIGLLLIGSPLEIYIFSNMGYLFAVALSLVGYAVYRRSKADPDRPLKMPGWMWPVALVIGVVFLFLWVVGGYFAADYAVGAGHRGLYWFGLLLLALWFPLYAWRRFEDKRSGTTFYNRLAAETAKESTTAGGTPVVGS
jgi:amino acid transporter